MILYLLLIVGCQSEGETLDIPASDHNLLLVSHLKEPLLTVIDLEESTVIKELDIPFIVSDMTKVNESEIILSSQQSEYLFSLNITNHKLKPLYEVGKGINELLYIEETEMIYATNAMEDELLKINLDSDSSVKRVSTDEHPASMTYDYNKNELYVANVYDHSIQSFTGDTLELIESFTILERPNGLLYFDEHLIAGGHGSTGELNRNSFIFSLKDQETIQQIETGLMPIDFIKNKDKLYSISHGSHEVFEIDPDTLEVTKMLDIGYNPYYSFVYDDYLLISALDGHTITFIDMNLFEITQEIDVAPGPHAIVLLEGIK